MGEEEGDVEVLEVIEGESVSWASNASEPVEDLGESDPWRDKRVAHLLDAEPLKSFWEFASKSRRTRSTAARESQRIRGAWLTPDLVVQRVHGWGVQSVRLLCIRATEEGDHERLKDFFENDHRNVESKVDSGPDPLDAHPRVLVKLPFSESSETSVCHEQVVLQDLAGLPGIPKLEAPIYFEDARVSAVTYEYCEAQCLQEQLERGELVPMESSHRLLSFVLLTLESAHQKGWMHADLSAKDVLLPLKARTDADDCEASVSSGLICGWSRAMRVAPGGVLSADGLVGLVRRGLNMKSSSLPRNTVCSLPAPTPSPSIYSAPEQFVEALIDVPCTTPATDVYRAASLLLVATRGRGPLAAPGGIGPVAPDLVPCLDELRRCCREAILYRVEATVTDGNVPVTTAASTSSLLPLQQLLNAPLRFAVAGVGDSEQQAEFVSEQQAEFIGWFERALAKAPNMRFQGPRETLEAFDEAWSTWEARLIEERHRAAEDAELQSRNSSVIAKYNTITSGESPRPGSRNRLSVDSLEPECFREMKTL